MLPIWSLPWWGAALANVAAAVVFHAGAGYLAHRVPASHLQHDGPLLRIRSWERDGEWYRRRLRIGRWKDRLPEAGALFAGGVSKRQLPSASAEGLAAFERETRRAERSHWWAMLLGPAATLWNPPVGSVAMVSYAVAVNAPFVAVQRFNRARIQRVRRRRSR